MAGNGKFNRIDEFFLHSDSPRIFGSSSQRTVPAPFSSPQAYDSDKQRTRQFLPSSPTSSSSGMSSSATSSSSSGGSETSRGRQSSISSLFSVDAARPPWQPLQSLDQATVMANYNYNFGYDLPCEFGFSGCHLRFHPQNFEDWIDHSVSHFAGHSPPARTVCSFCDREFDCTSRPNDARQNWRQRMEHIGGHFYDLRRFDGVEVNHPRPDFWILEYLNSRGLISPQDYSAATGYSERPRCDNTHPHGWKPQEMRSKEERNSGISHDLRREKHQRKKEKDKRPAKTGKTHRHHS